MDTDRNRRILIWSACIAVVISVISWFVKGVVRFENLLDPFFLTGSIFGLARIWMIPEKPIWYKGFEEWLKAGTIVWVSAILLATTIFTPLVGGLVAAYMLMLLTIITVFIVVCGAAVILTLGGIIVLTKKMVAPFVTWCVARLRTPMVH
ncbi:MAG: hypothetical protein KBC33_03455 [Candidatus Pacebacteria bacterium]|nr:hypothetical protein [Candidatus Paceibacterota bacterium]